MIETELEGRIKKSATKLFLKYGYSEVNMSQIAEAAGISRPTLYYYFRSKDIIFKVVLGDVVQELVPKLTSELHKDIPLEEKIASIIHEYFTLFLKEPEIPMFMLKEINRDASHLKKTIYDERLEVYVNELIQTFNNEVEKGNMNPVKPLHIFLTFCGLIYIPFVSKDLVKITFMKDHQKSANELKEIISQWEPYVVDSMRRLLLKSPKSI